ncbi:U32 family peptidase [Streptomyces sp. b94]|uniref:U32 family peptidase n=1 Tax=Streptomyces sp. b94 TaxID=1827634 RepID=UPI001B39A110|nr:U32 family peptidase [Streptomyces sp. b94]MBQ1098268.1 U32 family peptidase [Streptomyces sp. b94]
MSDVTDQWELAPPHTEREAPFVAVPDPATAAAVALDAPVRNLQMLELQITGGATEIYLAQRAPADTAGSFDALPGKRDGDTTQVSNRRLVKEIISQAHTAGLKVNLCADAPAVAAGDKEAFLAHVAQGIDAGADTVVVGALPTARWIADAHPGVPLVAGAPLGVSTAAYALRLQETYRVRRIVVPHATGLDEIAAFCALDGLEVEVPVQTGSGADCHHCRMPDQPGSGLGCRAGYQNTPGSGDGAPVDLGGFLDGASDCALCDVPSLVALGVAALQIPGRESPIIRQNAKITQMYRRALDGVARGWSTKQTVADIDRVELTWQMGWVPRMCEQQRCRFRDTPRRRTHV